MENTHSSNGLVEPYSTIKEAAEKLGLKPWALRKAVRNGIIPGYKFIGKRWMVKVSEVDAAITSFNRGGRNV